MDTLQDGPLVSGRGAPINPVGRFESIDVVPDPDEAPDSIRTRFFRDNSKTIVSFNDSPDVGMTATVNPYRGCEHGCIYCYARPTHEYLGLSCGLDFETQIFVKMDAAQLLREKLSSSSWTPQSLAFSGVTDAYQPGERKLGITRQCMEVMAEFRNPVGIVTKNHLVTRDIDLLSELARHQAACVFISITSLDEALAGVMEPRASRPSLRLEAVRRLTEAGIPVGVMMAPIIPGLTDHEIDAVLAAAADAGAITAHYNIVRLPFGVKDLFQKWLAVHRPQRARKVLSHISDIRRGKLNDSRFGSRMVGEGPYAKIIGNLFAVAKRRHGLDRRIPSLSTAAFRSGRPKQLQLF